MKNVKKAAPMRHLLFAGLALFSLVFTSCVKDRISPEGDPTIKIIETTSFTGLDVSDAFSVIVRFSDTEESVEIEANPNIHPFIDADVSGDRLRIGINKNVSIQGRAVLNAVITTKNLDYFRGSGATAFRLDDKLVAQDLDIVMSGASEFMGEVEAENIDMNITGASEVDIIGFSDNFKARLTGASEIKDYGFETNSLTIDLSGASEAKLTVENEISITASGASLLRYKGSAAIIESNLSGASDVEKVN